MFPWRNHTPLAVITRYHGAVGS